MSQSNWLVVIFAGYFFVFLFGVLWLATFEGRRSKGRPPVDFLLLRGPGETLRRKVAAFHEEFIFQVAAAALVPLAAGFVVLLAIDRIFHPAAPIGIGVELAATAAVFAGAMTLMAATLRERLQSHKNCSLGYLGERAVGEAMEPLLVEGYRVFHDVPMSKGCFPFNLDHVAVGPNGVFVIETKARRKGRARPGFDDHRVTYDGRQLIWPWGEDATTPQQAENRAAVLSRWLNAMTSLGICARPVLALPGWFVNVQGVGRLMVVNHKQLAAVVMRGGDRALGPDQVDLLARQLDTICRDVED